MSHATGAPVVYNPNIQTTGPRAPPLLYGVRRLKNLAAFNREVIPERRMHVKAWGAHGTFIVTHVVNLYSKAKIFAEVGKKPDLFICFLTGTYERSAAVKHARCKTHP